MIRDSLRRLKRRLLGNTPTGPVRVSFGEVVGEVPAGTRLLDAAEILGVDLDHFCGGKCSCGSCKVKVIEGADQLSRLGLDERVTLGTAADKGYRLACQARAEGPVCLEVPRFFLVG